MTENSFFEICVKQCMGLFFCYVVWLRHVDILEITQHLDKSTISQVSRNFSSLYRILLPYVFLYRLLCHLHPTPCVGAESLEIWMSNGLHERWIIRNSAKVRTLIISLNWSKSSFSETRFLSLLNTALQWMSYF
jgi:hypothetical protein